MNVLLEDSWTAPPSPEQFEEDIKVSSNVKSSSVRIHCDPEEEPVISAWEIWLSQRSPMKIWNWNILGGTQTWCGALAEEVVAHPESRENWMNCMNSMQQIVNGSLCRHQENLQRVRQAQEELRSEHNRSLLRDFVGTWYPWTCPWWEPVFTSVLIRSWSWTFTLCYFWTQLWTAWLS